MEMKKVISLILVIVMCFALCACGKSEAVVKVEELISAIGEVALESRGAIESAQEAFNALPEEEKAEVENYYVLVESHDAFKQLEEAATKTNAKEVYENIKSAWTIADQMGTGIYNVWHGWVYEKEEMSSGGLQFFADKASISLDDIVEGFSARNYVNEQFAKTGVNWNDISEADKEFYRDATVKAFEQARKARQYAGMSDVLWGTVYSFMLNGYVDGAQTLLESAKQELKELPADYEYYSALKDFYTTTSALVDFCASPSGSLDQYKVLLNDYRKEARDYMNDLNFVFE
jgi:hypothetical protein